MIVYMFRDRFAELVRDGSKRQTIRHGLPRCKPGDAMSLRRWTGKPYRSKQEELRVAVCAEVTLCYASVVRGLGWFIVVGTDARSHVYGDALEDLARADGFVDAEDMEQWFVATHGCDFHGHLIKWTVQ
jgi:hypothetical protein